MTNEKRQPAAEALTTEQLDEVAGGPISNGVSVLAWARVDGAPQEQQAKLKGSDG